MNLLILNADAREYLEILGPKFPEGTIHAAESEGVVGSFRQLLAGAFAG